MIGAFRCGRDVLLFTDWTLLMRFPPLRALWTPIGVQAEVPISGHDARGVLFRAITVCTRRRTVYLDRKAGSHAARQFLKHLRSAYRRPGTISLLVDRASAKTAKFTQALAAQPRIRLL